MLKLFLTFDDGDTKERSLFRIDEASLFQTFGSLKIRNFGYTPSCLQFFKKSVYNFGLFLCTLVFRISKNL